MLHRHRKPLVWQAIRMEAELIASLRDHAERRETTLSQLVRETLREKFGLLRITHRGNGPRRAS